MPNDWTVQLKFECVAPDDQAGPSFPPPDSPESPDLPDSPDSPEAEVKEEEPQEENVQASKVNRGKSDASRAHFHGDGVNNLFTTLCLSLEIATVCLMADTVSH